MIEAFGCCSHYVECSDKGICLFVNDNEYRNCQYSKNLSAGRIFYGKSYTSTTELNMCDVKDNTVIESKSEKSIKMDNSQYSKPQKIFLDCYNRQFNIGHQDIRGLTFSLSSKEYDDILLVFSNLNIPLELELNPEKCVMEGSDIEPANSSVVFTLPNSEQSYVISNYNSCLILNRYAKGIQKALKNKGINANISVSFDRTERFKSYNVNKPDKTKANMPSDTSSTSSTSTHPAQASKAKPEMEARHKNVSGSMNISRNVKQVSFVDIMHF